MKNKTPMSYEWFLALTLVTDVITLTFVYAASRSPRLEGWLVIGILGLIVVMLAMNARLLSITLPTIIEWVRNNVLR